MTKEIKVALLMAASLFMEILDGTIVTTALPSMAKYFNTGSATTALLVSVYLITVAIFIPLSGWAMNRFGKKRMWLLAVILFTLSSLGNAMAPTFGFLLLMRFFQGISGALMTPTARLIVLERTEPSRLLVMTSYLVWPALMAPAIAPVVGGFIVTWWSWRWIFFINLPIGLLIVLIGLYLVPKDVECKKNRFDLLGFLEIALASGLILVGAEAATRGPSYELFAGIMVLLGAVSGWFAYRHLKTVSNPLFGIQSLKVPSFRISLTGGAVLWLSVGAMPYLMTVYLQTVFNWSPIKAGGFVIFIFLGNIGIKPFTTPIIRTLHYRGAMVAAFSMVLLSSLALALITPATAHVLIAILAFISGVGRSLALTAYNGLSFSEIKLADRNSANTLYSVVQTLAQGLGVSLITVIVATMTTLLSQTVAYQIGFVFLGLLMIYPIWEVARLPKDLGAVTLR